MKKFHFAKVVFFASFFFSFFFGFGERSEYKFSPVQKKVFILSLFPFQEQKFLSDNLSINLSLVMEKIFYCSESVSEYKSVGSVTEYKKHLVPFLTYSNN